MFEIPAEICIFTIMAYLNVEILNPKAEKLLQDLADLKLISIAEKSDDPFFSAIKKVRSKKSKLTLYQIAQEVDIVRDKRYGKKAK